MKIRQAIELINVFGILNAKTTEIFYHDGNNSILDEEFQKLICKKRDENKCYFTTQKYIEDSIFHIIKYDKFSDNDDILLNNVIDKINNAKEVLNYYELYMSLKTVQLDSLLQIVLDKLPENHIFDDKCRSFIIHHIMKMDEWASQTYENKKFSFALGIDLSSSENSDINIYDLYHDSLLKVLSSGEDTILVCNKIGNILRYEKLYSAYNSNSPTIYSKIASWSKNKLAIVLTLLGEILIFYNQEFLYLKHAGKWYSAESSALYCKMNVKGGYNEKMQEAIVHTCFDVSFRRCGGCIGIVDEDCPLIYDIDRYMIAQTPRAAFFKQILGNKKFQDIAREIRRELVGIDGATVIDKDGNILAIGAILRINPMHMQERTTGGRSVAARQLGEYGIGIKISADGNVEAWNKNSRGDVEKFIEVL